MNRRVALALLLALGLLAGLLLWWSEPSSTEEGDVAGEPPAAPQEPRAAELKGVGQIAADASPSAEIAHALENCERVLERKVDVERELLRGRIVDAETGEGIASADVFLWPRGKRPPRSVYDEFARMDVHGTLPVLANTLYETDAEGRFAFLGGFDNVARGDPLDLHMLSPRHAYRVAPVEVPGTIEIALERGRTLKGWVVDPSRRPVPGACVRAIRGRQENPIFGRPHVIASTVADMDGAFVIHVSGIDFTWLEAVSETGRRSASARVRSDSEEPVELVLDARSHVTLDIRTADGGAMPIAGLRRAKWREVLWETGWFYEPPTRQRVAMAPMPPGPLPESITLRVPGYQSVVVDLQPDAVEQAHELVLPRRGPTGTVRLRLAWPELGQDPSQESVFLRVVNGAMRMWDFHDVKFQQRRIAGGTSEVELGPLPPGKYQYQGIGRHVAQFDAPLQVVAGEEGVLDINLRRGASLEVVFADADATGTGFSLQWGTALGIGLDGIQEHRFGRDGFRDDVLSRMDGSRWTSSFVAAPDGTGSAVGVVHGLLPSRCILRVSPPYEPAVNPIEVKLVAGETTRVEVRRKE